MITIEAVLENFDTLEFTAWPIAEPSGDHFLVLSGHMTPAEVGTAMALLISNIEVPAEPLTELHHRLDRHLDEAEALVLAGGLRLRDTKAQAEVVPGCCCGLEDWRDWTKILHEQDDIWLGHDPETIVEITDGTVRLHQEMHTSSPDHPRPTLALDLSDLPALLSCAHQQLQGFLALVGQWAGQFSPEAADRLVEILDENFHIKDPLLHD